MNQTVNGVTSYYIWAGGLLVARYTPAQNGNPAETLAWRYDQGGIMLGFARTIGTGDTAVTTNYFYVRNLQNDVVAVLNAAGDIVAEYIYDAWGNLLYSSGYMADINPIRYRGYYWDAEIGLFYLQSRYYDPSLRRFISADLYMDTADGIMGTNMYAYCHNDPINYYDPDGYKKKKIKASADGFYRMPSSGPWHGPRPAPGSIITPLQAATRSTNPQQFLRQQWLAQPPRQEVFKPFHQLISVQGGRQPQRQQKRQRQRCRQQQGRLHQVILRVRRVCHMTQCVIQMVFMLTHVWRRCSRICYRMGQSL